jgi:polysaccharide biosynthesis protein PslH
VTPARPTLLYLVHRVPYPPDKGDRIRAFHVLSYLAKRADVHLATLADEPVPEATHHALGRLCARTAVVPLTSWTRWPRALASLVRGRTITEGAFHAPALCRTLTQWAATTRYAAAVTESSSMVPYLNLPALREIPAVADLVDVDSQKWFDYAEASRGPKRWLYRTEGHRLRRVEIDAARRANAVTLVSAAEADLFRRFCPDGQVHAVANGVDLDYFRSPDGSAAPEESACAFVGALDYKPNVDGADWFCREVWPTIQKYRAGAKLYLVGRKPAPAVQRLASLPGVELVGQVPDVRPWLVRSAVAVVPLRIARGVQNKVLEALAMGKAVVASPQALAGVRTEPGVHLLSAGSPAEWAEAVGRLLDDVDLRRRLGSAGRAFVEEHHRWERCLDPLGRLLGLSPDRTA